METVVISSKYQMVIPKSIREKLNIKPGDKISFLEVGGGLRLVKAIPVSEIRGRLRGMDSDIEREEDHRL